MNLPQPWSGWLSQWSKLTAEETLAIKAEEWTQVAEVQQLKEQLQKEISTAGQSTPKSEEFKREIARLCEAERQNANLIEEIRQQRQSEHQAWESARHQLQAVRRSYGQRGAMAGWHSYG